MAETEATYMEVEDNYFKRILAELKCPECMRDSTVDCARDKDVTCKHCNKEFCAHHVLKHLVTNHQVSVEWRGAIKADKEKTIIIQMHKGTIEEVYNLPPGYTYKEQDSEWST